MPYLKCHDFAVLALASILSNVLKHWILEQHNCIRFDNEMITKSLISERKLGYKSVCMSHTSLTLVQNWSFGVDQCCHPLQPLGSGCSS